MRSQIPKPYGLITIVPRTSDGSARPACFTTSWYQPGKSSDCLGSAMRGSVTGARGGVPVLRPVAGIALALRRLGVGAGEDPTELLHVLLVESLRHDRDDEPDRHASESRHEECDRSVDNC